ncbi:DUF2914 domain-containing protein [Pseudoalteromonas sp. SSMSWG5]|uniref:DUF2914 domain-containing protein n=1 Tax=Pseudoalteromonas sp. SSMSWG5 TaxID=3139396 RepID=UPI003BAB48C6
MTKKIVITANMNAEKSESRLETVTYQWHWRRIFMVSSVIFVALAAVIYSFVGAVNAEQAETDEQSAEPTGTVMQQPTASDTVSPSELEPASPQQQEPAIQVVEQKQDVEAPADEQPLTSDLETETTAQAEAIDEASPVLEEENRDEPIVIAKNSDVQQQFSQSAHIASLAIGAKIDTDKVSRAVLTTDVVDREPVNVLKNDVKLSEITQSLSFFSELKNMQGQTVRHQWYYQGTQLASIELAITSPRFRTYSTKNIMPEQLGEWRVEVVDAQGTLLAQKEFRLLAD